MKELDIKHVLYRSFDVWLNHFGQAILAPVIFLGIPAVLLSTVFVVSEGFELFVIVPIWTLVALYFSSGFLKYSLDIVDGKKPLVRTLFLTYRPFISMFLLSVFAVLVLLVVLVGAGLALWQVSPSLWILSVFVAFFVWPILWSILFLFAPWFVVSEKVWAFKSLKMSLELTRGVRYKLFLFFLILFVIQSVASVLPIIGNVVVTSYLVIVVGYVFRYLQQQGGDAKDVFGGKSAQDVISELAKSD